MGRALGINALMSIGFESTPGTAATAMGKVPFVSADIGPSQGLLTDNILGLGRSPSEVGRDVVDVGGSIQIPVDVRNIGFWLRGLLGDPTSTPGSPNTHAYASGGSSVEALSIEVQHPAPGPAENFLNLGCKIGSMGFNFQPSGLAEASVEVIGMSSSNSGTPHDSGGVDALAVTRFNQFQGSIEVGDSVLGNVTGATMNFSNGLEPVRVISTNQGVAGVDELKESLTGDLTVRFDDTVILDLAEAGTKSKLELIYTIDANEKLHFTINEVIFARVPQSVSGEGGVEATYTWQANKPSSGNMLDCVLTNDQADMDIAAS